MFRTHKLLFYFTTNSTIYFQPKIKHLFIRITYLILDLEILDLTKQNICSALSVYDDTLSFAKVNLTVSTLKNVLVYLLEKIHNIRVVHLLELIF